MKHIIISVLSILYALNSIAQLNIPKNNFKKLESVKRVNAPLLKSSGKEYVINIINQADFNQIDVKLRNAIRKYHNILVKLEPGVFYYKNKHLYLGGINTQDLSICIEGNNTILIPHGKDFSNLNTRYEGDIDFRKCFLTNEYKYMNFNGSYNQSYTLVEIIDEKRKSCRIRTNFPNQDSGGAYIQLNTWYMVKTYPITKIKGGYIYFTATDLQFVNSYNCYNVNYDYSICKIFPRYLVKNLRNNSPISIYKNNVVLPLNVSSVHECNASQFLMLHSVELKNFSLKRVCFIGNNSVDQLLSIRNVKAEKILFENCTFRYIKSPIIRCINTNNLEFSSNTVEDCFGNAIWSYNNCANTVITDNLFIRTINNVDRSSCVLCFGENFYVANNVFKNFGGMAIFAGIKYNQPKTAPNSGIIENNEIFYTSDYLDFMRKYSLIDGGAIYLSTHTDGIIVRYNYIHGFGGVDSKRSIYCDDGCYNTKIYGNVIVQPDDEQAVFEWYSSGAAAKTSKSNSGIDFMYNVIWGKYKLEERPKSDCVHGKNVMMYTGERPQNVLKNFAAQEEDVYVREPMLRNSLKELSPGTMKAIMDLPTYQGMKKWFE